MVRVCVCVNLPAGQRGGGFFFFFFFFFSYCLVVFFVCFSLQTLDELEKNMGLPSAQLLGLFRRAMEHVNKAFRRLREQHIEAKLPESRVSVV